MANTANDLARDIGLELGIIDSTSDLSANDLTDITNRSRQVHAQLRVSHVCYWDEDDVPDEVYFPLVSYLASCCGKTFGKVVRDDGLDESGTRRARLEELKTAAMPHYSGAAMKSDFPWTGRRRFNFRSGS